MKTASLMDMCALPVWMSVYHMGAWYLRRPEKGVRCPGTGVIAVVWALRIEPSSYERTGSVCLTTEHLLRPPVVFLEVAQNCLCSKELCDFSMKAGLHPFWQNK